MHQQHTIEELDCTPSAVGVYVHIEKENQCYYIEHKHEPFKMEFDILLGQHIAQIVIH